MSTKSEHSHITVTLAKTYRDRDRIDAHAVGVRLVSLMKEHRNRMTHETVLAEARREESPLHAAFEWSDTQAAERYRIQQANALLGAIHISIKRPPSEGGSENPVGVNIQLTHEERGEQTVYIVHVSQSVGDRQEDPKNAREEAAVLAMRSFVYRYGDLKLTQPVVAIMENVLEKIH